MIINVWLALRDDAQAAIVARLKWDEETQGEYSGPVTERLHRLFSRMADRATVQRLYRADKIGEYTWTLWSLYFDFPTNALLKIKAELDALQAAYPSHVAVCGAWRWDGRQVKSDGEPVYPVHARILELMPDIVTYDADGNETSRTRPTEPSDINILQGQSFRQFT